MCSGIVSERRKQLQQKKTAATGTTAISPSKRLLRSEKVSTRLVTDKCINSSYPSQSKTVVDDQETHFPIMGYSGEIQHNQH